MNEDTKKKEALRLPRLPRLGHLVNHPPMIVDLVFDIHPNTARGARNNHHGFIASTPTTTHCDGTVVSSKIAQIEAQH